MKKMTVRLSADIFDYCKSYGQVIERFEVISLFNMVDDMHSEVCRFTIREGVPVDQIKCNYVSNLIVLQNKGREFTCLVKGTFSDDITRFLKTYGSKFEPPVVFENDCLSFNMVGTRRTSIRLLPMLPRKDGDSRSSRSANTIPMSTGFLTSSRKNKKRSCWNHTGPGFSIIPGGLTPVNWQRRWACTKPRCWNTSIKQRNG